MFASLAAIPISFRMSVRAYRSDKDPVFAVLAIAVLIAITVIIVLPFFR